MKFLLLLLLTSEAAAYTLPSPRAISASLSSSVGDGNHDTTINPHLLSDRRMVLSQVALATSFLTCTANAQEVDTSTLDKRIIDNELTPPPYGMEATDIFYPPYFQGNWKALSKTTEIFAPCGFDLFPGRKGGYDNTVEKEIKGREVLEYRARFVQGSTGDASYIAADREYNAKEIAKAAMGSFSVVDVSVATPNRFSCTLAPPEGSGGSLISVDILAIARKYEPISPNKFCCSEVVRQIVSPTNRSNPNALPTSPLSVKEIETISVYTADNVGGDDSTVNEIKCRQRTATFLVPSQTDPIAFKMWQMSRGQPVDVRYYDVTYSKV